MQSFWNSRRTWCCRRPVLTLSVIWVLVTSTCVALTDRLEDAYVQYDKNLRPPGGKFLQIYPTGQNFSLELMFAKFATAKNREKFKPTKTYVHWLLMSENNTEE